jgi:hypothetical protein
MPFFYYVLYSFNEYKEDYLDKALVKTKVCRLYSHIIKRTTDIIIYNKGIEVILAKSQVVSGVNTEKLSIIGIKTVMFFMIVIKDSLL